MRSGPWWPAEFYASVSRGGRATAFNAIHIRNGPNNLGPNTLEACSHIHIQARSHIAVLKPPAQRSSPSSRVVPGRLAVLHKLAERYRPARRKPARRRQVALQRRSMQMMLVYNLPQTGAIFNRFGGIDGSAYFIGGFGMTALTANRIVVVPIRSGIGLRLGANLGYLKFTESPTWNPF